jgi:hypothetical protein
MFNGAVSFGDQFRVLLWLKPAWANLRRIWNGMGPELRFKKWLAASLLLTGFPCGFVGAILLFDYASFSAHSSLWIIAVALIGGGLVGALVGNAIWFYCRKASEIK